MLLAGVMGELASIIIVGRWLGVLPTLALIVLGSVVGLRIVRSAGLTLAEAVRQRSLDRRSVNALDRALLAGAGLLFALPGFLTDLAGLFLLVPTTRRWLGRRIAGRVMEFTASRPDASPGPVIDGEAVEIDRESPRDQGRISVRPAERE